MALRMIKPSTTPPPMSAPPNASQAATAFALRKIAVIVLEIGFGGAQRSERIRRRSHTDGGAARTATHSPPQPARHLVPLVSSDPFLEIGAQICFFKRLSVQGAVLVRRVVLEMRSAAVRRVVSIGKYRTEAPST
jgi:hypothetical protein